MAQPIWTFLAATRATLVTSLYDNATHSLVQRLCSVYNGAVEPVCEYGYTWDVVEMFSWENTVR